MLALRPMLDVFDQVLVRRLNDSIRRRVEALVDVEWDEVAGEDAKTARVLERRVRVGLHNGRVFVRAPEIIVLHPAPSAEGPSHHGDPSRADIQSNPSSPEQHRAKQSLEHDSQAISGSQPALCFQGSLPLTGFVHHPDFAVVFQLEYRIALPVPQPRKTTVKLPLTQERVIVIGWAPFLPSAVSYKNDRTYEHGHLTDPCYAEEQKVSLRLRSDTAPNVSNALVYNSQPLSIDSKRNDESFSGSAIDIIFNFHVVSSTPKSQPVGIPEKPDKENVEPGQDQQLQDPEMRETAAVANQVIVFTGDELRKREKGPYLLTRAAKARLLAAGFQSITDERGQKPVEMHGAHRRIDLSLEEKDVRIINEFVFQAMGISFFPSEMAGKLPGSVFFTFQFYTFPFLTTKRMHLNHDENMTGEIPGELHPSIVYHYDADGNPDRKMFR